MLSKKDRDAFDSALNALAKAAELEQTKHVQNIKIVNKEAIRTILKIHSEVSSINVYVKLLLVFNVLFMILLGVS